MGRWLCLYVCKIAHFLAYVRRVIKISFAPHEMGLNIYLSSGNNFAQGSELIDAR